MYKNIHLYGLYRLKIEIKNLIKQVLRIQARPNRNVDHINDIYQEIRKNKFKKLDDFKNPEEYLFDNSYLYPNGKLRYSMLHNKIVFGKSNHVALLVLQIIEDIMNNNSYKYVIELGSGGGKNLIWLASKYNHINFIGLELNSISVDLSNAAAKKFNVTNIEFHVCDLTNVEDYSRFLNKETFIYSHHTLEEMPRIYKKPLIAIKNSSVKVIALLEPVYFFKFSRFLLDISKRLRIFNKDRLIGLQSFCKKHLRKSFNIEIQDLGLAVKPENSTSLVLLKRKK